MGMEKECLQALEEMIIKMEQLPATPASEGFPGVAEAIAPFCRLYHIAKVELCLTANRHVVANSVQGRHNVILFHAGEADENRTYTFQRNTGEGNDLEYFISPQKDAADWTEEDMSHIRSFATMLFVYNGRARVMNLVEHLTFYDHDLNMHNLNYFIKYLGGMFAQGKMKDYAGCRFNIKALSVVNRQLGREGGTEMMIRFINGLERIIGEDGCISRLGGDNYVMMFHKMHEAQVKEFLGGTLLETGRPGIEKIRMSAAAGFYSVTENCRDPHGFMERISIAYENARRSNILWAVYDEQTKHINEMKRWVEGHFSQAIEQEEFLVYYQPKVDLRENMLCGAEALCRWKHGEELILPGRFIPLLEQGNMICILDFYMLEHVCRDIRRWIDEGIPVVKVSINMSRVHMGNEDLAGQILGIIDKYQVPHEYIEIELTETTTDVNFRELKEVVGQLHDKGISTAVDDFGVGYSSLNLIRELPWDVLKIDKSFLPEFTDANSDPKKIMLNSVVNMAHELGLECVVEGTETKEQIELLNQCSCKRAQGFYFDKPLPREEFEKRLLQPEYKK